MMMMTDPRSTVYQARTVQLNHILLFSVERSSPVLLHCINRGNHTLTLNTNTSLTLSLTLTLTLTRIISLTLTLTLNLTLSLNLTIILNLTLILTLKFQIELLPRHEPSTISISHMASFVTSHWGQSLIFMPSMTVFVGEFYISINSFGPDNERKGNVWFNNTLNTFYLRLYGIRHMVKDHADSKRGNLLLPHRLLFPISSKGSFICLIPQTG